MPGHRCNIQVASWPSEPVQHDQDPDDLLQWAAALPKQQQQQQSRHGHCSTLLQQLDALGWDKVAQVSADLSCVTLQLRDAGGRLHSAALQLSGFPVAAPTVTAELPVSPWKPRWLPGHTLCQLVLQLQQVLDSFQAFWQQLEDLDQHTQLFDTQQALARPYSTTRRCVALGNGCSCQLQLDPARPTALPQPVFHGASSRVAELQSRWFGAAHAVWDDRQSVRHNLQSVLQLTLPAPKPGAAKGCAAVLAARAGCPAGAAAGPADAADMLPSDEDSDGGDGDGPCAVCYAMHLPDPARPEELGDAPSISCTGPACGRVFHSACLAEWLGALPSSRRVFDMLFGSCPFCNTDISVCTRHG